MEFTISFTITEEEARALDALTGYSADEFIKYFYDHLGRALVPYERGLRSFLSTVREQIPQHLQRMTDTRKLWSKTT
jgi:hypothetical protein